VVLIPPTGAKARCMIFRSCRTLYLCTSVSVSVSASDSEGVTVTAVQCCVAVPWSGANSPLRRAIYTINDRGRARRPSNLRAPAKSRRSFAAISGRLRGGGGLSYFGAPTGPRAHNPAYISCTTSFSKQHMSKIWIEPLKGSVSLKQIRSRNCLMKSEIELLGNLDRRPLGYLTVQI
jgi:hypothetical protein